MRFRNKLFEDEVYLFFYHYSDEYDAEVKSILFAEFHTSEKLRDKFELAKKWLKGSAWLMNKLQEQEIETIEQDERFKVTDLESANWVFKS